MRSRSVRAVVAAGLLAALVAPMGHAGAVSVPSAPEVDGRIRIVSDNDYALFAGDASNVSRVVHQNNDVFWDQITAASSVRITLYDDEPYLYLLGMGGGGAEDIGGTLNGVDVTSLTSGANGIQRATGRAGGTVQDGYLLVNPSLTGWDAASNFNCGGGINVCFGLYAAELSEVRTALTGATWGNPPSVIGGQAGNAYGYPDSTAVMFRIKASALGRGIPVASGTSVTVSWDAPSSDGGGPILDYTVTAYRASDNSNSGRTCTTPNGSTMSCQVTGLTGGVAYYFKVTARNSAGTGAASAATGAIAVGDFAPPTLTLSASSATQSTNNVTFTLSANEAIDCSTVSPTAGVDFTVSGGTISSVTARGSDECAIVVATTVLAGSSTSVILTRAASFSVADVSGNAQTAVSGSPATVTVTVPVATTTTSPPVTSTSVPAQSPTTTAAPVLEIVVNAPTTTTVAPAAPGVSAGPAATTATTTALRSSAASSRGAVIPTVASTTTTLPNNAGGTVAPSAPRIEAVDPGEAAVSVGGTAEPVDVNRADNQLTISAGAMSATFARIDRTGNVAPLDPEGNVHLLPGDTVRIKLAGFEPLSEVEAWLFSTPVLMGRTKVKADGTVTGNYMVPRDAPAGAHRIAVVASTKDGKPAVLTVGIRVGEWERETSIALWLIVLPLVLAVTAALLLPATRRRRRGSEASV